MFVREAVRERDDDREDHRGRADDGGADEHGLGGRLEGVAGAVVLLEEVLGLLELDVEAEVLLDLLLDVRDALDDGELVDALRVVGDRTVRVDGDRDRTHAEEAEGDEAEGEDRGRVEAADHHDVAEARRAARVGHHVRGAHEDDEDDAHPVGAEVTGGEAGEDVERRAALASRT